MNFSRFLNLKHPGGNDDNLGGGGGQGGGTSEELGIGSDDRPGG